MRSRLNAYMSDSKKLFNTLFITELNKNKQAFHSDGNVVMIAIELQMFLANFLMDIPI